MVFLCHAIWYKFHEKVFPSSKQNWVLGTSGTPKKLQQRKWYYKTWLRINQLLYHHSLSNRSCKQNAIVLDSHEVSENSNIQKMQKSFTFLTVYTSEVNVLALACRSVIRWYANSIILTRVLVLASIDGRRSHTLQR